MPVRQYSLLTLLACTALSLSGCATPSQSSAMVAPSPAPMKKHPGSINVTVTGGSETSAAAISKISDRDFAEAVKASIVQSGLFSKIANGADGDYQLDIQIVRLDQPIFGASFTVTLETTWTLRRNSDRQIAWQKAVISKFTASMGDSLLGVTRLRLANEGAARTNIQDAIAQMSALSLP